jgi:hypothetical protein
MIGAERVARNLDASPVEVGDLQFSSASKGTWKTRVEVAPPTLDNVSVQRGGGWDRF